MKYILSTKNEHVIMFISDTLDYQNNGNYLINNGTLAVPPVLADMAAVEGVPENVEPDKWCYTAQDGFYPNPNWHPAPPSPEERLSEIENMIDILIGEEVVENE